MWTLHHGDSFELLTSIQQVDHMITDPPYSDHVHSKQWIGKALTDKKKRNTKHKELGFDPITKKHIAAILEWSAANIPRWSIIFADIEGSVLWRHRGLHFIRTCIWDKVDSAPQFTGDRPASSAEAFVCLHQPGKLRWNAGGKRNVYRVPVNGDKGAKPHPSTKPVDLMRAIIRDFTDPGETIFDPFAGSGTTGVAAICEGRNFIGIEKRKDFYDIAHQRLTNARQQFDVFGVGVV